MNTTKEIEKANAYREMFKTWPWQDFEQFLDSERKTALELAIQSEDMKEIQVNRGKVKQIDSIKSHLGYITSEHN